MLGNRVKFQYEEKIVPTALYRADTGYEKCREKKSKVLEMKCVKFSKKDTNGSS